MKPVVAIDGPAGSGKGTLARMIASHFNFVYLDTGVLYRTIAYLNIPLVKMRNLTIREVLNFSAKLTDEQLRSEKNGERASNIAKLPEIRELMNNLQRDFIGIYTKKGIVLDGRDIGTIVVPDACCKLFITADLRERAKRRYNDLRAKNIKVTLDEVYENMRMRDNQDKDRKIAPLTCDESYIVIDTTKQSIEESFKTCRDAVKRAFVDSEFGSFV